jgi:hypothetical protein
MTQVIERTQLVSALERCCNANPASGTGSRLHPDASLMADLLGIMIHHKTNSAELAEVPEEIRAALARWS